MIMTATRTTGRLARCQESLLRGKLRGRLHNHDHGMYKWFHWIYGGFFKMEVPKHVGFTMENPTINGWFRGTAILGNLHTSMIDNHSYSMVFNGIHWCSIFAYLGSSWPHGSLDFVVFAQTRRWFPTSKASSKWSPRGRRNSDAGGLLLLKTLPESQWTSTNRRRLLGSLGNGRFGPNPGRAHHTGSSLWVLRWSQPPNIKHPPRCKWSQIDPLLNHGF